MQEQILKLLERKNYAPSNVAQLAQQLGLPPQQRRPLQSTLDSLEQSGQVVRTKGDRYIKSREADLLAGVIHINRQGKGFFEPDDPRLKEIVIPESVTVNRACTATVSWCGATFVLSRWAERASAHGPARWCAFWNDSARNWSARCRKAGNFSTSCPMTRACPHDIYVPPARDVGRPAQVGDKVVVELRDWQSRHTNPEGEITEVLGAPDEEGVDMLSVLRHYDLPLRFPTKVLQEARSLARAHSSGEPTEAECAGRVDVRSHQVITIDPDDAKDFDDAILFATGRARSMAPLGSHRRCVPLREARQRA